MIEGLSEALADIDETPVLLYSERRLAEAVDMLLTWGASQLGSRADFYFAAKACYVPAVLRFCLARGMGIEVMSALEFDLAHAVGFRARRIICNGAGRPDALLRRACSEEATIVIESEGDLERLIPSARAQGKVSLGLRLQLDVSRFAESPYALRPHKLGLPLDSAATARILDLCSATPELELHLLHCHVALNARNAEIYVHALTALADARQTIEQSHPSIRFDTIDLGGGFAAPDDSGVEGILREIGAHFGSLFPDCRLALEPGRLLVSDAGFVVTSVTEVKEISGHHFVFVDAGTNVLIPIPTARYRVLHPAPHVADGFVCDVVDGITSPSNVIVRGAKVSAKPRKGDRWILAGAGAYTSSMSAFWGFMPFPVQWLDSQGRRSVLLSRETIAAAGATLLGL